MRLGKYRRVKVDENSRHADRDLRHILFGINSFTKGRARNLRQEVSRGLHTPGPSRSILLEDVPRGRETVAGSLESLHSVGIWLVTLPSHSVPVFEFFEEARA